MPQPSLKAQSTVVIYARVSSKEQEKEGFSIPAQLKLLRGYAAGHRFTVIEEFVDVETARRTGRPGFTTMVEFFKKQQKAKGSGNNRRTLLVEKTDRLYRNLKDWVTLDDLDLEIHFVKENVVLAHDSRSSEKFMPASRSSWLRTTSIICQRKPVKGCWRKPSKGSGRPLHPSVFEIS